MRTQIAFLVCVLSLLACGSSKKSTTSPDAEDKAALPGEVIAPSSDTGGVVIGIVTADSTKAQKLKASDSSNIKGVATSFPASSFTSNAKVTIEEGDNLVSSNTNADLGIADGGVAAASKPVLVTSNPIVNPSTPYTLQIPISASLRLNAASTYVVLYKIQKEGDPIYYVGFIPATSLTIVGNNVTFKASFFGAYQLISVTGDMSSVVEVKTISPPVSSANAFPEGGTWTAACQVCRNNAANCYEKDIFVASGSSVSVTVEHYADSDCLLKGDTAVAYSTYLGGGSVTIPSGASAVDIYATKYFVTPTSLGASAMNSKSFCGLTNWTADKKVDITGLICDSAAPTANSTRKIFSNYKRSGSTIVFGAPASSSVDDGSTSEKRMVGTDTITYTKS